jgi:hypothetical protein
LLHELAASQHALVRNVRLPSSTERCHGTPTPEASNQTSTLKVGALSLRNPRGDECSVGSPGSWAQAAEVLEDHSRVLPGNRPGPAERRVPGIWVPRERAEIAHHSGTERVQMEVANEFE